MKHPNSPLNKFNKSAFLPAFLIFSLAALTMPLRVSAAYTGQFQVNSVVMQEGGGVQSSHSSNGPSLSQQGSAFSSSLYEKSFGGSVDGAGTVVPGPGSEWGNSYRECGPNEITAISGNVFVGGIGYFDVWGVGWTTAPPCLPSPLEPLTTQNTQFVAGAPLGSVIQSYDAPVVFLGREDVGARVSSRANDPNNVDVIYSANSRAENYVARFKRTGDVKAVFNGYWGAFLGGDGIYKDGRTYWIDWTTDWMGQPLPASCYENNDAIQCYYKYVYNSVPAPQILQVPADSYLESPVVHQRNSDIVFATQPQCRYGSSDGFWKSRQWADCVTYGLSADGRTGVANYHDEHSSSGWWRDIVGLGITALSLYAGLGGFGNIFNLGFSVNLGIAGDAFSFISAANQVAQLAAINFAVIQQISSPSSLGTVETSNNLGVGNWSWSPLPPPPVPPPPSCSYFSSSPSRIVEGNQSALSWSCSNADSCSIDNGVGPVGATGAANVSPSRTTTYTISCSGPGGNINYNTTITVDEKPVCIFSASPSTIIPPQSSSLGWSCTKATSCSINNGIGSVGTSGSKTVSPTQTTTYNLSCTGSGNAQSSFQTTITVRSYQIKEIAP